MNLHQYAVYIEQRVRSLIGKGTERYALGGIVNSDFIEYGGMVTAICAGLVKHYQGENVESIDKFLEEISEYNGVRFIDLGESKIVEVCDKLKKLTENF
ncbi:hypothetical protein [Peptoclostridium acidaminophilum]|jgi:hypothetical protein|uniref:hypothetical protein n=1 Tax=Peptoclostridium acidaminophilum TaxID=1731 RepID=UPI00046C90AF|nr:hypothetical protein [Peptoclostridium acidaminophilum]